MPKSVNRISFNNLYLVLLVFTLASGCALSLQREGPSQHQHTSECRHELDREKRERFLLPVINDELLPPTVDNSAGPHITATLPLLHSLSTSSKKIYLNFVGCSTRNWGGYANAYSPAYDSDGNTASLSTAEANAITEIWKRVSEDFAPFNLDVTTEAPSSFTPATALEVCIGGSWSLWFGSSAGGVAYISSWLYGNTPVWVFEDNLGNGNAKYTAEAASHEVGHALGLSHQSTWSNTCVLTAQYSTGSGSGETGWAPIMGVGYYQNFTTWANGPTPGGCTATQDNLATIIRTSNQINYRTDDIGDTTSSATPLAVSGTSVSQSGIISLASEKDYFSFTTGTGIITIAVDNFEPGPNLDLRVKLIDSLGGLVADSNSSSDLDSAISTTVSAGTYFIEVGSSGAYGSVGQYTISGTIIATAADTTKPTGAIYSAGNVTSAGGTTYDLAIRYSDNASLMVSSFNSGDIVVSGPNGFSSSPVYVSVDNSTNGNPRVATYRLNAPGGAWDSSDNGSYSISLVANEIADTSGNTANAASLGSFSVSISAPADSDGDSVLDSVDCAPSDSTRYRNTAYPDPDDDGAPDSQSLETISCFGVTVPTHYTLLENGIDNCPGLANPDQLDTDRDGTGNACESDDDNDGVSDNTDCAPIDGLKYRTLAYPDPDLDRVPNSSSLVTTECYGALAPSGYTASGGSLDNCPNTANASQADSDGDGMGDACEFGDNPPEDDDETPSIFDFDGDGESDLVSFDSSNTISGGAVHHITHSADADVSHVEFGVVGGASVPGEYTGDSLTDLAEVRVVNGNLHWSIRSTFDTSIEEVDFGLSGALVVPNCDFNSDGINELTVIMSGRIFSYDLAAGAGTTGGIVLPPGSLATYASCADINGDGISEILRLQSKISRKSTSFSSKTAQLFASSFSGVAIKAIKAASYSGVFAIDYNADGKSDLGIAKVSRGKWSVVLSPAGSKKQIKYSLPFVPTFYSPFSYLQDDAVATGLLVRSPDGQLYLYKGMSLTPLPTTHTVLGGSLLKADRAIIVSQ